mgnify:CR=1 FL=1
MAAASPPPVVLARATPADIREAAELYAAVFSTNPAYASIFSGLPSSRQGPALRWLFERRMRVLLAAGNPFVVGRDPNSGRMVAAAGAVLPGHRPGTLRLLWHGLAAWPLLWGLDSMRRALSLEERLQGGGVVGDDGREDGGDHSGSTSSGKGQAACDDCRLAMLAVCADWRVSLGYTLESCVHQCRCCKWARAHACSPSATAHKWPTPRKRAHTYARP